MKRIFLFVGIMVILLSSVSFAQDQDLARDIFQKYRAIRDYALELREDNIQKTQEIQELKERMIVEINDGIEVFNQISSKEYELDKEVDFYEFSLIELYDLNMELIIAITDLLVE